MFYSLNKKAKKYLRFVRNNEFGSQRLYPTTLATHTNMMHIWKIIAACDILGIIKTITDK